ncbi:PTS transporter subunit EIIC [Paenibacillus sp. FSL P2-0089]|uniref:PTS sugar transporter subunit IIC n=1 Tax=Paenibacillus sp. FSL P2-0089 TaxID=2954526 RepID=UPI00315A6D35
MNGFLGILQKMVVPLAAKLSSNKALQSVSKGLMGLMVIMMMGAFSTILSSLPFDAYQNFLVSSNLKGVFNTLLNVTTNMLGLYAAFSIAYSYVSNEDKDGFSAGAISLMCFFIVTPLTVTGEGYMAITNLPFDWIGPKGLFTSMIVAIVVSKLYVFIIDRNITIKMPEGVPEFVSKSFVSIIPGIFIGTLFGVISYLISLTSFGDMHQIIYKLIQTPLTGLGSSIWAALLVYVLIGLCWFFGVHGMAVMSVVIPIWSALDAENLVGVAAGVANSDLPNIVTLTWVSAVATIGGAGSTIGLVIWLTFKAKSKQYKVFGKMALIPSLFNINEPVIFGLPVMLNPLLFIPFVFTPVLLIGLAYILVTIGILPISNGIGAPMGTPLVLQGFFNGGWRLGLYQVFGVLLSLVIYYPFFRIMDKKAVEEESAAEMAAQ